MELSARLLKPIRGTSAKFKFAIACLIVIGVGLSALIYQQRQQYERMNVLLSAIQSSNEFKHRATPKKSEADDKKQWDVFKAERSFPWPGIFEAMEDTAGNHIELLEFEPAKSSRLIILRGEAKDQPALIHFIAALSEKKQLKNVHLLHQQRIERERLITTSFEIKADVR